MPKLGQGQIAQFVEDDEVHAGQVIGKPALPGVAGLDLEAITRAGTPVAVAYGGISRVTTAPAQIVAPSPIVTPHRTVAFDPIDAFRHTRVGSTFQSAGPCNLPSDVVALGNLSLMNITPCPTKTSSSMVTPSHMKE
jgi:hypothetical protein